MYKEFFITLCFVILTINAQENFSQTTEIQGNEVSEQETLVNIDNASNESGMESDEYSDPENENEDMEVRESRHYNGHHHHRPHGHGHGHHGHRGHHGHGGHGHGYGGHGHHHG